MPPSPRTQTAKLDEQTTNDLDSLEPITAFNGNRSLMFRASGTADGRLIAVATGDRTASLFDTATGTRLGDPLPISIATNNPNPPSRSPDGKWLAVGIESQSWTGSVRRPTRRTRGPRRCIRGRGE